LLASVFILGYDLFENIRAYIDQKEAGVLRAVIVDDEKLAIDLICHLLKKYDVNVTATYINPREALANAISDMPDVIFVDIDMPEINGILLAQSIKAILNDVIIIFVTAYSRYAVESFQVHPMDYLLKPIRASLFDKTMENIIKQYELLYFKRTKEEKNSTIAIRCFGKLEVIKGSQEVMKFPTLKSKELFSYLICHANMPIYKDEILTALFPGKDDSRNLNNYYVTVSRLRRALVNYGVEESVFKFNKNYDVYIKEGVCDYVDFTALVRNNTVINCDNIMDYEVIVEKYYGELFMDFDTVWTNEAREWVEIQMEEILLFMADYYKGRHQNKYEMLLNKLIKVNPIATKGYEELLKYYIMTKKKEKYRFIYQKYVTLMEEMNLDIDTSFIKANS
jgi:Response regulator containing CheY-like receiver and SARP domains